MTKFGDMFDFGDGNGPVPASRHCNGGGWVGKGTFIYGDTYIGPDAMVFGRASVYNSTITDRARIHGSADVYNSQVGGKAMISDHAKVRDSTILGSALIHVNAQVSRCTIGGTVEIRGNAIVKDVTLNGKERITRSYNPALVGPARDVAGRLTEAGQRVVRTVPPQDGYPVTDLEIRRVERVDGTRVWLDGSKSPIHHPNRLAVIA